MQSIATNADCQVLLIGVQSCIIVFRFCRFHKQLGIGKLNVKSPSKECKLLLKERQEQNAKASNEAFDCFEVALGKLTERLSSKDGTFLLTLATNAFVEAGKNLVAFNFTEERGNKRSWMEVESGLEELVMAMRETKMDSVAILERAMKLQHATQEYKASEHWSPLAINSEKTVSRWMFKFMRT